MMGHVCRKLHPHSSLGSASVRTRCLDGSVISVFQVTGDTEEIHQENAEVSFPFQLQPFMFSMLPSWIIIGCYSVLGKFSLALTLHSYQIQDSLIQKCALVCPKYACTVALTVLPMVLKFRFVSETVTALRSTEVFCQGSDTIDLV